MPLLGLLLCLCIFQGLEAQESFTKKEILKYFTLKNPFIYTALGQKYIYKEREKYQLGNFDTNLAIKYEKKDYPVSKGEFFSSGLEMPFENGMELNALYRKAEGIQEYNNIKTGDKGEVLLGMKIPVFAVIKDINKKKLDYQSAKLDRKKIDYQTQDNIRLLYFDTLVSYYKLLYFKENLQLVEGLLANAKERATIIEKRVKVGSLAKVSILEVKQQIINRKQQLLSSQNNYRNALERFTQYLNLRPRVFLQNYKLLSLLETKKNHVESVCTVQEAVENRPDLKVFAYEKKKLRLEQEYASVSKYPKLNLAMSAVHDFKYDNGFKISLDMDFPIERRKYLGKSLEIKKKTRYIEGQKEKKILGIKTRFNTISNSIHVLEENIKNAALEVALVEELDVVENKKYNIGLSNLFMVNQREIYTLSIKKKFLKYNLEYLILQEELNNVVAKPIEELLLIK